MDPFDDEDNLDEDFDDKDEDVGDGGYVVDCALCGEASWADQTKVCRRCEERYCGICHTNHPCM